MYVGEPLVYIQSSTIVLYLGFFSQLCGLPWDDSYIYLQQNPVASTKLSQELIKPHEINFESV